MFLLLVLLSLYVCEDEIGRKFVLVVVDLIWNDLVEIILILNNCVEKLMPLLKFC